jgi:hypothetical protein
VNKFEDAFVVIRQTELENHDLRVEHLGKGIGISNYSSI